jgi:RNA recognition motif-containing protein
MIDRETGRSKGFGFVTYGSSDEAETAISSMNEQECVNPALTFTSLARSSIAPVLT